MRLARAFHVLQLRAATFDDLAELQRHLVAQKFDDRQSRHQVDGNVPVGLRTIQRGHMDLHQHALELAAISRPVGLYLLRVAGLAEHARWAGGRICLFCGNIFNIAVLRNQAEQLLPRDFREFGTQEYVVTNVINAAHQPVERDMRDVGRERKLPCKLGEIALLLKERKWHTGTRPPKSGSPGRLMFWRRKRSLS